MKSLSVVFMGSPDFAIPSLDAIHASRHTIRAVVSGPDKRRRRGGTPEPTVVKQRAIELGLPVLEIDDPKSDRAYEQLSSVPADLYVVVAFKILPPRLLALPSIGSVNLHASLLPKYRGAAPIHRAIIEGETETGCTVFFLEERVDTGRILAVHKEPIGADETTGDLYDRLKEAGAQLLVNTLDAIADGTTKPVEQDDRLATPAPKLFRENTKIDFNRPAQDVHNLVRGLQPFPVAWCMYGDQKMNIHRTQLLEEDEIHAREPIQGESTGDIHEVPTTGEAIPSTRTKESEQVPGQLIVQNGRLLVACKDGLLEILRLQLPGTKKMSGQEFINGYETGVVLQ
jgi:methionyl-tRNA formyltransferase